MVLIKKKPEPQQKPFNDNNVVRQFINNIVKRVPELNLRFDSFYNGGSRLIYEGEYCKGKIVKFMDSSISLDKGIRQLEKVIKDIDYVMDFFESYYKGTPFTLLEYIDDPSYSSTIRVEIEDEIKEIKYRPHIQRIEEVLPVVIKKSEENDKSGVYRVGSKKLENILLKYPNKKIAIKILD